MDSLHQRLFRLGSAAPGLSSMPDDLVEQAVARLRLMAGLLTVATTVFSLLALVLPAEALGVRGDVTRPVAAIPTAALISALMAGLTRVRRISARHKLHLGMGYLVALALVIAWFRHGLPYYPDDVVRAPSPLMVLILFFGVIVPLPPRRVLVAGLLAACMEPLGLWLTIQAGNPPPTTALWVWLTFPAFAGALLATVAAHILRQLGREVSEARELGSYKLVERLGEGGMGEVWLARHAMLARPAAVKLIKGDRLGAADAGLAQRVRQRFEREAQATAALHSPHTIELFDFGVAGDGTFYYVMELLDGMDLDTLVEEHGPVTPARAVHLLEQACHSLRDAHHAGVVHRDIKPANLFVCRKGWELDFVKVLDFGLVRLDEPVGDSSGKLTADGAITGTPHFLPPEMATAGGEVDGRADLYALGCVAYWLLTGETVFEGQTTLQLIMAHVQTPPVPPSERAGIDLPADLEALVLRCLAKDPADRPQSPQELLDALEATGLARRWTRRDAEDWWGAYGPPGDAPAVKGPSTEPLADTLPGR